ncbi:MAG: polysaccharide biosynthesis/export family protein [Prosthecobacter sp.]
MTANPILWTAVLSILLLIPKAVSEEKPPPRKIDTLKSMEELDNSQKLKPGNVISIRFLEDKRAASQGVVATTGEAYSPYIGLIKAEGLTCRELAFKIKPELAKLEKGYLVDFRVSPAVDKSFFKNATVLVTLDAEGEHVTRFRDPDLPFVVAFGAVAKQGKFDFAGIPDHKLSGLIEYAGGLTSKNASPKIRVIRKTDQGNKTIVVDGKALLNKSREADLVLQASDVVFFE